MTHPWVAHGDAAAIVAVVVVSLALMLIRPRGIAEAWWIGLGATFLVVARLVPLRLAMRAVGSGSDVYFFLAGMMLLAALARDEGVFDWLAVTAIRRSRGSGPRLFTTVYAVGTVVTIFMSNDAAAVVLTPAILTAVKRAKAPPLPYLFVCAFVANAASFVLPISNPANLVVFDGDMPKLGVWLRFFALPSALSILMTYLVLRVHFRRDLGASVNADGAQTPLSGGGRSVLSGLALVTLVLLATSALHEPLGLPTLLVAVGVTVTISCMGRKSPIPLLRGISVSTLCLVAGLFIMVSAVESVGAVEQTRAWLTAAGALSPAMGALVTGSAVAVVNNAVNNLPLGLLAGATLRGAQPAALLRQAVLIGVDLGPNLSVTGSLATILWLMALRKEKVEVTFWQFMKVGLVAMPLALVAAVSGAILAAKVFPHLGR